MGQDGYPGLLAVALSAGGAQDVPSHGVPSVTYGEPIHWEALHLLK